MRSAPFSVENALLYTLRIERMDSSIPGSLPIPAVSHFTISLQQQQRQTHNIHSHRHNTTLYYDSHDECTGSPVCLYIDSRGACKEAVDV